MSAQAPNDTALRFENISHLSQQLDPNQPTLKTGLFFDSRCLLHQANYRHVEGPARVLKSYERLVNSGLWNQCHHLQVEGMSLLDKTNDRGHKLLYGSNVPGLKYIIDDKFDVISTPEEEKNTPETIIESAQPPNMPQFSHYLQASLTRAPIFRPLYPHPSRIITDAEIHTVHDAEHIRTLDDASTEYAFGDDEPDSETEDDPVIYPDCVFLNPDLFVNRYTRAAARLAATGVLELAKAVVKGDLENAFALIRPPGHHADATNAGGFCLYNNIAVAARHLLLHHRDAVQRVLIVDFDVHHGNGTQNCFYKDDSTLFISIHRFAEGFFPESGAHTEIGEDKGRGFTANIPVPLEVSDFEYLSAWERIVAPMAQAFAPDVVFISAGFDCLKGDPLGGMALSPACLHYLTRALMSKRVCRTGKVIAALEGGYNPDVVAEGVCAVVSALLGDPLPPLAHPHEGLSIRQAKKHPARMKQFHTSVSAVARTLAPFWPCLKATATSRTHWHARAPDEVLTAFKAACLDEDESIPALLPLNAVSDERMSSSSSSSASSSASASCASTPAHTPLPIEAMSLPVPEVDVASAEDDALTASLAQLRI